MQHLTKVEGHVTDEHVEVGRVRKPIKIEMYRLNLMRSDVRCNLVAANTIYNIPSSRLIYRNGSIVDGKTTWNSCMECVMLS